MPDFARTDTLDVTALLSDIKQAFVPLPERFERLSDFAKAFRVRGEINTDADAEDWRMADPDLIIRNENLAGLFVFMDGPSWRHYLPLWLTAAATHGGELRLLVSAVITTLDPESKVLADDADRFAERTAGLTAAQKAAIADVFAHVGSLPWVRANDKTVCKVERLMSLWRAG